MGVSRAYSSRAWAIQPAVRAMAKMASPAPRVMPVTWARAARARSTFGSGRPRRPGGGAAQVGEEDPGAGVAVGVEAVAEAAEAFAPAQARPDHAGGVAGPLDLAQQGLDPQGRPAVQGPADRGQPGRRHRVRV